LQEGISISTNETQEYLDNIISFINMIDNSLPSEYKLLFWWGRVDIPDFFSLDEISLINMNGNFTRMKYFE
jgi:hypothetical protein